MEVIDAGLEDNPVKAREAAGLLHSEDVNLVFLFVFTYGLSSTVLPEAHCSQERTSRWQENTR